MLVRELHNGRKCLEDITYNYPLLLDGDIPEAIERTLDTYEGIIPKLQEAYDKLNPLQENPHNPDIESKYYAGKDHLEPLKNFKELGLERPEPSGP